jgi:hypothetical protein
LRIENCSRDERLAFSILNSAFSIRFPPRRHLHDLADQHDLPLSFAAMANSAAGSSQRFGELGIEN